MGVTVWLPPAKELVSGHLAPQRMGKKLVSGHLVPQRMLVTLPEMRWTGSAVQGAALEISSWTCFKYSLQYDPNPGLDFSFDMNLQQADCERVFLGDGRMQ